LTRLEKFLDEEERASSVNEKNPALPLVKEPALPINRGNTIPPQPYTNEYL
jgi:hypothetical protein